MPNLDFFATRTDLEPVVDFVMNEAECIAFESYSIPGKKLRKFTTPKQALAAFDDSPSHALTLMLYAPAMRGRYRVKRFELKTDAYKATWRENIEGWGLISLDLYGVWRKTLAMSHTNHNSEKRARNWEGTYPELPPAAEWDFAAVTSISGRINRYIRKLGVAKDGPRPILADAQAKLKAGKIKLRPFR